MREILYIRLHSGAADAVCAYSVARPDAALSFAVHRAPLGEILAHAGTRRVIVLVPGADVRLTRITVPARQPAKVLQAAPYALEDQLAEDVDTLHFALGPRQADGSHPVAVVARARMDEWLAAFREAGVQPEALIPETLCLPETQDQRWSALAEPGQVTVRSAAYSGFGCLDGDLPLFMELADPDKQAQLRILMPRNFDGDFTALGWPVELLPGFVEPLEALLQHLHLERSINLLQGAYSQRESLRRLWQPWRVAAVLAVVWLVVAALDHGIEVIRLKHAVAAQQQANVQRYQQIFPGETRIVDLAAQAEQQMARLKGGGAHGSFLPLLEQLSGALTATPGLQTQALQFRDGALFVSLTGTDLQQLESLRGWFAQHTGAQLDVQSANAGNDGVQIRIKLTPA